jgi:hypothetical protein
VSTLESSPLREAEFFIDALHERRLNLGAIVLNKVLPAYLLDADAAAAASVMGRESAALGADLAPVVGADPADVARLVADVAASFHNYAVAATREAEQRAELAGAPEVVSVPQLGGELTDLAGVLDLGRHLWRPR